ncbi:MAG: tRNA dihydrouridine synthase DusB [Rhodobacteraceae bacterium]|nr:tRNA dihydrouridine synthase DusB [Paracoccaceae bacterium]
MAGITDLPFRRVVAGFGAGLVVSEMVASAELLTARPSARARAELGLGEGATAVQLAGREAGAMAEAARMLEGQGARIIDINMGCPAKKVTSGWSGSALMREPDHALRLIEAVRGAVSVPVTLKMRLGWDEGCLNAPELAVRAEGAGVSMITVHGRTRCQFYRGAADWAAIAAVVRAVSVPVVANGDIIDASTARAALAASGAAAVMVGRGARGRPWVLASIAAGLGLMPLPDIPHGAQRAALVAAHYDAILSFYGRELGLRVARKHLGWYLDAAAEGGAEGRAIPSDLRRAILTADTPARVMALMADALSGVPSLPARAQAA